MDKINVILPDGSVKEYPRGVKLEEVASDLGPGLGQAAVAGKVNGKVVGLSHRLDHGGHVKIITFDAGEGREVYRHSAAHVLAQAVKRLFPDARLGIGPPIEEGFYYDFDVPRPFTPEDLERIEAEMKKIIEEDHAFICRSLSREEALAFFRQMGEPYKVELIDDLPEDADITVYSQGEFTDLCMGPHLPATGRIREFKLLSAAGAYWRGDEKRPMLQRIYGTAFERKNELDAYLHKVEEARRRDHRRLGKELDLFSIHEEAGAGLVFWHPRGALVREMIEGFWREEHRKRGYELVYSPHIARVDLWRTSGHLETFRENMYSPMDIDGIEYMLKPMNCPFHILMYKSHTRSYRDLPLRWGELGTVYRYERSGVLHGLLRVRGFTQDDAHIFCRPDQVENEICGVVELAQFMMKSFGFENYDIKLSVRDRTGQSKYIGEQDVWERAEAALARALERMKLSYQVDEGEAKFYGPAIDVTLKDALGRGWQGPTIQLDFNLPERFDMTYAGEDGREHRPVMIHRTVLGSMERFIGSLIEHYAGAFPTWLAPVQVRILPITDRHVEYAGEVRHTLAAEGVRVDLDARNEKVGYKIRQAELEKVPYMLVVGEREVESRMVSLRVREEGDRGPIKLDDLVRMVLQDVENKNVRIPMLAATEA